MMEVRTQQSGRLEDVSPLDLLQSLGIYRRPGHVLFFHPHGRSQLWFEAGEIVDAESGALRGAAAVFRIATHDRGEYRVEVTGQARARTIEGSGSGLIFEAARRLDEGQRRWTRLPAAEAVLMVAVAGVGPSETHERVAALFEGGATVGEVLERSPLGELETLQCVVELVEAGRLADTGAVRAAALAAIDGLEALGRARVELEPSQPFVPSASYLEPPEPEAPLVRRSWWIHATVGAVVAGAVTLVLVRSPADVAPEAPPLAVAGGAVAVIDGAAAPRGSVPAPATAPSADERPAARSASSRTTPALVPAPSSSRSIKAKRGSVGPSRSQPDPAATKRSAPRSEPADGPEDASSLLAAARRAYASGQGETAYRLASRSQRLRPSDAAAELLALAACLLQRPDAALDALRSVPLLRRGSVRSTCKQAHGVRLKLARAR